MNPRIVFCAGGLMATATAALIFIGPDPEPVAGQATQSRSAYTATTVAEPFPASQQPNLFQPSAEPRRINDPFGRRGVSPEATPVQQVQSAAPQGETEIQRQLRALYEKDGKQMPQMNMNQLPSTPQGVKSTMPRDLRKPAAAPPQEQNSRFGFLKKIFPFGRKHEEKPVVPQQRPVAQPQYYAPPNYGQPAYRQPQYTQQPSGGTVPAQPVRVQVVRQPTAQPDPNAPLLFSDDPKVPANKVAAPNNNAGNTAPAFPQINTPKDNIPVLIDDSQPPTQPKVQQQPQTTVRKPAAKVGGFDPFPNGSESEVDNSPPAKTVTIPKPVETPATNVQTPGAEENPFTGQKLTDETPKAQPTEKLPVLGSNENPFTDSSKKTEPEVKLEIKQELPVANEEKKDLPPLEIRSAQEIRQAQEASKHPLRQDVGKVTLKAEPDLQPQPAKAVRTTSKEEKMRMIAERSGMSGFRGFCPVVLRDERELADAKPEFHATFDGKTYFFSSAAAKASFDKRPEKYAPANSGNDVIVDLSKKESVEGSLQYAVWFRDRLYFFGSAATLKTFVQDPQKYAGN